MPSAFYINLCKNHKRCDDFLSLYGVFLLYQSAEVRITRRLSHSEVSYGLDIAP